MGDLSALLLFYKVSIPERVVKRSFRQVPMQGLRKGPRALSEVLRSILA